MACYTLRRHCGKILDRGLEQFPEHRGLLHALMLGYREALPEDWHTAFAETGTLHIFAISGLHVGVNGRPFYCRVTYGWFFSSGLDPVAISFVGHLCLLRGIKTQCFAGAGNGAGLLVSPGPGAKAG